MPALVRPNGGRGARKVHPGIRPASYQRGWDKVVCVASGPSFSLEQAQLLQDPLQLAVQGWHTIVVNTSWQRLPRADVLYAGDSAWWDMHLAQVRAGFAGELWTQDRRTAHQAGLHHIQHSNEPGLSHVHGRVHSGGNSGYVALGLAYLFGAKRIVLVGYDFQDTGGMAHWHGNHPPGLNQDRPFAGWIVSMGSLAAGLKEVGVDVVNCSTETALTCFPRGDLAQCLST